MKLTKTQLKKIIKEELENIMTEEEVDDASERGRPKQWYDEPNSDPALDRPGTQIAAWVDTETRSLGLTPEALTEWRPEKKRGGRRRKASS